MTYSYQYARRRGYITKDSNPFKTRYLLKDGKFVREDHHISWERASKSMLELGSTYRFTFDPSNIAEAWEALWSDTTVESLSLSRSRRQNSEQ